MKLRSLLILFALGWPAVSGAAETIPVQGLLTDSQGVPLTASVEVTFSLYDTDEGGTPIWQETVAVEVDNGLFSVYLGQAVALDLSLFKDHQELWLGIQVAEDQEMNRVYLGNVPFAAYARHTDATPGADFPSGFCMFSFSQPDCPAGWTKNVAHVDRTMMIAADSPGQTGGSDTHTHEAGSLSAPSHTHTTGAHALTVQEMPAHTHEYTGTRTDFWHGNTVDTSNALVQESYSNTSSTGGGQAHDHGDTGSAGAGALTGSSAAGSSLPPYVSVVVCCKN